MKLLNYYCYFNLNPVLLNLPKKICCRNLISLQSYNESHAVLGMVMYVIMVITLNQPIQPFMLENVNIM